MPREKLQQLIASLHRELGSSGSLDEQSRELLQQLIRDLEDIAADKSPQTENRDSAAGQLETAALKFETDHPKLSMLLGDIMDTLGKLGI